MRGVTPLFWAVAALLVVSGAAKVRRPAPATEALADLGWRLPPAVVRALAGAEAAVGGAALLWGGWPMEGGAALIYVPISFCEPHSCYETTAISDSWQQTRLRKATQEKLALKN